MAKGGNGALVTSSSISVSAGTQYTIVVGAGGSYSGNSEEGTGKAGGTSTAFGLSAAGGKGAGTGTNGANAGNGSGGAGSSSGAGAAGWVSFSYDIVVTSPQYCKITVGTS